MRLVRKYIRTKWEIRRLEKTWIKHIISTIEKIWFGYINCMSRGTSGKVFKAWSNKKKMERKTKENEYTKQKIERSLEKDAIDFILTPTVQPKPFYPAFRINKLKYDVKQHCNIYFKLLYISAEKYGWHSICIYKYFIFI